MTDQVGAAVRARIEASAAANIPKIEKTWRFGTKTKVGVELERYDCLAGSLSVKHPSRRLALIA
jgi:hypothetical protein